MRGRSAAVAQSHRRARHEAPAEPLLDRDDAPPTQVDLMIDKGGCLP